MRVEVAQHAGVCYGVERALKLAEEKSSSPSDVHTLGPLIHNPQAVSDLKMKGIAVAESLDQVDSGTLIIRSHGVDPAIIDAADAKGLDVIDATCPFVSAAHKCARELAEEGYSVIIVGEEEHPEVEGILAHAGGRATIIQSADDIPEKLPSRRVGIVVQTTQPLSRLSEVVDLLLPRVNELRVCNTICNATAKRQLSAEELARTVDVMTPGKSYRFPLMDLINRLDAQIDVQAGRVGLMQRWLDDQTQQLDDLAGLRLDSRDDLDDASAQVVVDHQTGYGHDQAAHGGDHRFRHVLRNGESSDLGVV